MPCCRPTLPTALLLGLLLAPAPVAAGVDSEAPRPILAASEVTDPAGVPSRTETVAIGYFDNNSGSDRFEYLRKALADMLITDLSVAKSIQIVEREKLEVLLKELSLSDTRFIDPATALRIGQGLSAGYVLTGAYTVVDQNLRIDARLVRTETGQVVLAREVDGSLDRFFALQKELARRLLDALDVRLAPVEQRAFETPLTTSLTALEQFGLGLDAQDSGDAETAREYFAAALDADPGFERARQAMAGLGRFMEAAASTVDLSLAGLSPADPDIGQKLDALATSLLSSALTDPVQKARLLSWLAEAGMDPEFSHFGIPTRMQPALLQDLTLWATMYEPRLSSKLLIAADVLARRHPDNPTLRNFVTMYGETLRGQVTAREEALRTLDRRAVEVGLPFGAANDFKCDGLDIDSYGAYQESAQVVLAVGEGALLESYARAAMQRLSVCTDSDWVASVGDLFAMPLFTAGRRDAALAAASPTLREALEGVPSMGPTDVRLYLLEFERALDAVARQDSRRQ
jgi:TolB-like protein